MIYSVYSRWVGTKGALGEVPQNRKKVLNAVCADLSDEGKENIKSCSVWENCISHFLGT